MIGRNLFLTHQELPMLNKFILPAIAAACMVLAMPAQVDAYGAAHRGYTHVGPNGVYHTGATVAAGPRGVAVTGHTTAAGYGGGAYRGGYGAGVGYGGAASYGFGGVGASYGGYRYGSNYNANAAAAARNGAFR
ncbi:MAG: hypothetical protein C0467_12715 [Planctomycetaceae bacterium]|nr:hypothetical protein [Planctomycetaceae bacterium]